MIGLVRTATVVPEVLGPAGPSIERREITFDEIEVKEILLDHAGIGQQPEDVKLVRYADGTISISWKVGWPSGS